ncbi:PilZ domain-containing protein [Methylobacterium nigriterrae]|uniref:PilZ domain-containing protein n=1 Tax=Methylobacterium nigriterrae TaxID=3127512 RepID=UPI003013D823
MFIEKRKVPRQNVFQVGQIFSGDCSVEVNCLVRNMSAMGALIEVALAESVPDQFDLLLPSNGQIRSCQVVRRTRHLLGVTFAKRATRGADE